MDSVGVRVGVVVHGVSVDADVGVIGVDVGWHTLIVVLNGDELKGAELGGRGGGHVHTTRKCKPNIH